MTGIYKITINDHYIYIGQSVDIENRWRQHLTTLQNHKHSNYKLQNKTIELQSRLIEKLEKQLENK